MTRGGCGEQGVKHKEEGVRTHEGYGEDKAAETEKKRLLERQGKHCTGNRGRL